MIFDKKIECPYCGEEMEKGNIVITGTGRGMFYLPEGEKLAMILTEKSVEEKNGVVLNGIYRTTFNEPSTSCHRCRKCQKIVIEY